MSKAKKIAGAIMLLAWALFLAHCGGSGSSGTASTAPQGSESAPREFSATMTGADETPPVDTPATGTLKVEIDEATGHIHTSLALQNLDSVVAAHIHLGGVGETGPIVFVLYDINTDGPFVSPMEKDFTEADFKPVGSLATFSDAINAIKSGGTYANAHTPAN